ncbi:hypothetical protein BDN67DRAFT_985398, partial [Paxillus ammoniavirescens]
YSHSAMVSLPPSPSISVSVSTPQANQPSIHSNLETEPTHTHTKCTEIITHEIDRLLHHIHELDHFRGQETHEISENVRINRSLGIHDLSLLGAEEEFNMPPPSPGWLSEPSSPSSDVTPSIISSSESSPEPSLSLTPSSSSPPPPSSPTPSMDSSSTACPVEEVMMTIIRDMLMQLHEQMTGLWDGQVSTNHILDELPQAGDAPRDDVEIHELLRHIENLIKTLIQRRQETTGEIRETRDESVTESDATLEILDVLHRGWSGRWGRPPPLIPFTYQPTVRPTRSRSTSPIRRWDSTPPPLDANHLIAKVQLEEMDAEERLVKDHEHPFCHQVDNLELEAGLAHIDDRQFIYMLAFVTMNMV